jgi:hypothetical protein
MPKIYTHELGGESSKAILTQLGFIESDLTAKRDMLEPKYCPECKEPNKPDALFCTKAGCGHPLSYAAYKDLAEREKAKDDEIAELKKKQSVFDKFMEDYIKNRGKIES